MGPRASLDVVEKRKISSLLGFKPQPVACWLSYLDSYLSFIKYRI
jgi:hypothetical protein